MKYLEQLSSKYRHAINKGTPIQELNRIFEKYLRKRKETLTELAVTSLALSIDIIENTENVIALKALEMTNPNFNPELIDNYSDSQLQGIINSSKGKYFELLVASKLNNGETVGNITLPDGYKAELASSMNQPGWDMKITDTKGNAVEYIQLKATESTKYIKETLEKYPDIRIVSTSEVAGTDEMVIATDISDESVTTEMEKVLDAEGDSFFDNMMEGFNPLFPLSIIVATQGYKVVAKRSTYEEAVKTVKSRSERAVLVSSIGALAYAMGTGWYSLPITIGTGVILDELKKYKDLNTYFGEIIPRLQIFNDYRKSKRLSHGIF